MDRGGAHYLSVKGELYAITQNYFTYLLADSTLPPQERRGILVRDTQIFLGLAHIYRDQPTKTYLEELLRKEDLQVAPFSSRNGQRTYRGERSETTEPKKNSRKKSFPSQTKKPPEELLDFHSREKICADLGIDQQMLEYILEKTQITLERRLIDNNSIDGITPPDYTRLRAYLHQLRS